MQNSILLKKADEFAHYIYKITADIPAKEIFALISQIRRSSISIPLNIVEGYARQSNKDFKRFLLISYGSLKETKYLIDFAFKEKYIDKQKYLKAIESAEEIGKILWSLNKKLKEKIQS